MGFRYRHRHQGPPVGVARPGSAIPPRLPCLACPALMAHIPRHSTCSACQTRLTGSLFIGVLAYMRAGIDASIDASCLNDAVRLSRCEEPRQAAGPIGPQYSIRALTSGHISMYWLFCLSGALYCSCLSLPVSASSCPAAEYTEYTLSAVGCC